MAVVRNPQTLPRRWYGVYAITLFTTLLALAALVVPSRSDAAPALPSAKAVKLTGTLQVTAGTCKGGKISGTYLRMILPSGGANGPYMSNNDSTCSDQSYTPLAPGKDGGLKIGAYQTTPSPRFGPDGDAKANRITAPARFYGTSFATATSKVDPQTKTAVPAPTLTLNGSTLSADLRAFAVTWNNQDFNQGAPKPSGATPGNTRAATGTYDATTGAFTLDWASQVQGGPFDKFTGSWHLEGRFVPAAGSQSPAQPAQKPSTSGGTTGGTSGGTVTPADPGAPAAPGDAPSAGAPAAGGTPGTAPAATSGEPAVAASATTKTLTEEKWRVSWPVLALAIGIAVLGFGALLGLRVLTRRAEAGA